MGLNIGESTRGIVQHATFSDGRYLEELFSKQCFCVLCKVELIVFGLILDIVGVIVLVVFTDRAIVWTLGKLGRAVSSNFEEIVEKTKEKVRQSTIAGTRLTSVWIWFANSGNFAVICVVLFILVCKKKRISNVSHISLLFFKNKNLEILLLYSVANLARVKVCHAGAERVPGSKSFGSVQIFKKFRQHVSDFFWPQPCVMTWKNKKPDYMEYHEIRLK